MDIHEFKDFEFVPLRFVTLGLESHMPDLRAIFHSGGSKPKGTNPKVTQERSNLQRCLSSNAVSNSAFRYMFLRGSRPIL